MGGRRGERLDFNNMRANCTFYVTRAESRPRPRFGDFLAAGLSENAAGLAESALIAGERARSFAITGIRCGFIVGMRYWEGDNEAILKMSCFGNFVKSIYEDLKKIVFTSTAGK